MSLYESDENIKKKFDELSNMIEPKPKLLKNCFNAFWVGGSICIIGEVIKNIMISIGISEIETGIYLPVIMIFLGGLLTGLGVYDKIAVIGGAGTLVPITGFSNAMTAPAIESKKEGYVIGVGTKMFSIAGPVLVYGIVGSFILGIIYYILLKLGVVI